MLYEYVFLCREDLSSKQVDEIIKKNKEIIENNQGSVVKVEYWGLRNLAYKIKKNKKAHYVMFNVSVPYEGLKELNRLTAINESILRTLAIKIDKVAEEPSLMLKQQKGVVSRDEELDGTNY